jgi:hypothetical protein
MKLQLCQVIFGEIFPIYLDLICNRKCKSNVNCFASDYELLALLIENSLSRPIHRIERAFHGAVSPNIAINNQVNATLAGKTEAVFNGTVVQIEGLVGAITASINAQIGSLVGSLKGASMNRGGGFDSQASAPNPGATWHNARRPLTTPCTTKEDNVLD